MTKTIRIAVDGPASSGKSTVAKLVAKDLHLTYLDTGAMYRAATLISLNRQTQNPKEIIDFLKRNPIAFQNTPTGQLVYLGLNDVTQLIRSNEVTAMVSEISALPEIRDYLVKAQQEIAAKASIIMDGRDIGTVVLPSAELKLFMVADVAERARRRYEENLAKGIPSDLEALKAGIERRDAYDSSREMSPLKQAPDAIRLDTTQMTISEVADFIEEKARKLIS